LLSKNRGGTYSYALDLSCPNRKRLEVFKNIKYIAITSRASKLQVFKVHPGRDLNLGHPCESRQLYNPQMKQMKVQIFLSGNFWKNNFCRFFPDWEIWEELILKTFPRLVILGRIKIPDFPS